MRNVTKQRTILVMEQDAVLRNSIISKLQGESYSVLTATDSAIIVNIMHNASIALIIIDSMLLRTGERGIYQQTYEYLTTAQIPVLMTVMSESEIVQLIRCEPWINDYIVKPIIWEELHACVQTLLHRGRRNNRQIVPRKKTIEALYQEGQVLSADDLLIDVDRHRVTRGNHQIELDQPLLFDLLTYMVRHRGVVLTRSRLLKYVWGYEQVNASRTVDVHMRWLREKIEDDPGSPQLIQTVRGVGYRFKE